jgi:hypothetical protein
LDRYQAIQTISESSFNQLSSEAIILNADLIEYITAPDNLLTIPLGSSVSFLHHNDINSSNFNFEGTKTSGEKIKRKLDQFGLVFECTLPLGW